MNSVLVFDIETALGILKRGEQPQINPATGTPYEYVNSFDDHSNPPAVTGTWDCVAGVPPMSFYFQEQLPILARIIEQRRWVASFNGISFDAPKLANFGLDIPKWKHFDLAAVLKELTGEYVSLDALAAVNLGSKKTGSGADAPLAWQRYKADPEKYQEDLWALLAYCMADCWLLWRLLMRVEKKGELIHPKLGRAVKLELPEGMV